MENYKTKSPVLFLIFNRPDVTEFVFEQIKKVQPKRFYVAADGPRDGKKNENNLCLQTRSIIEKIDWNCEIKTLFRDENLGCKYAVSSAIDWFFENEEQGIILEDDCLPSQHFFRYCDELLDKYKNHDQIMHIGGTNFHTNKNFGQDSYYFSNLTNVWGWASWRSAWKNYDVEMSKYNNTDSYQTFFSIFKHKIISDEWSKILKRLVENKIDTWDYQWTITILLNNGLSIMPNTNLIKNIGFGENATHTNNIKSNIPQPEIEDLPEKINHPIAIFPQKEADLITLKREFRVSKMRRNKIIHFFKFWKKYND
jgi:hypothetical protein